MYGDTTVIRGLSRQLGEQASDIDLEAEGLVGLADACPWSGWAADAMRRRSRLRAAALHRSAGRHRDAAEALAHHADEVDGVKDLIAAAERKVGRLLGDLGDLVDRFTPPPPGHRAWLRVEIPGLSA
jgi:hypothetical protein